MAPLSPLPQDVFAAALLEGGGIHSPVYSWLHEHHDAVALERTRHRVGWNSIAKQLALAGIYNGNGKAASAACIRVVWSRVRRAVQREKLSHVDRDAGTLADNAIVSASNVVLLPPRVEGTPSEAETDSGGPSRDAGGRSATGVDPISDIVEGGALIPEKDQVGVKAGQPKTKQRLMW